MLINNYKMFLIRLCSRHQVLRRAIIVIYFCLMLNIDNESVDRQTNIHFKENQI